VRNSVRTHKEGAFSPHMTLLHGVQPFSTLIDPAVKLTIRELALVRGRAGTSYEILNRWQLRDPGRA
jgi:2'-5' RNA ligase